MSNCIESLAIRGVRSYSPLKEDTQVIKFSPLTVISGPNGSGKTTIIEALKFLMSGEEPPLSDSRRNFIHHPYKKLSRDTKTYAQLKLNFKTGDGRHCVACREINYPPGMKIPTIQSRFSIDDSSWKFINKQDEWGQTIVKFFDLPNNAVINNVMMCHQENSSWMFSETSNVKLILEKIFGCEQYKKEIKYIETEIKALKTQLIYNQKSEIQIKETAEQKTQFILERDEKESQLSLANSDLLRFERNIETLRVDLEKIVVEIEAKEVVLGDLRFQRKNLADLEKRKSKSIEFFDKTDNSLNLTLEELNQRLKIVKQDISLFDEKRLELTTKEKECLKDLSNLQKRQTTLNECLNHAKVLELKFKETCNNLDAKLQNFVAEEKLELDNLQNYPKIVETLTKHEQKLHQARQEVTELERSLSDEYQELLSNQNELKSKIDCFNKEISTLQRVAASSKTFIDRVDPASKNLVKLVQKFDKMSLLSKDVQNSNLSQALDTLIGESRVIVNSIIESNNKELAYKHKELSENEAKIVRNFSLIEKAKLEKDLIVNTLSEKSVKLKAIKAEEKRAQFKAIELANSAKELKKLIEIRQEESHRLASQNLDAIDEELKSVLMQIESLKEKSILIREESMKLQDADSVNKREFDTININICAKELSKECEEKKLQVEELEKKLNVEEFEKLSKKKEELMTAFRVEREQRAATAATVSALDKDLVNLNKHLTKYNHSYQRLALVYGQIACTQLVIEDLVKLKDCFEKSVSKFHCQMMRKINELLKLRWKQIYQGEDISSIELVYQRQLRGEKSSFVYYIAMKKKKSEELFKMREQSSAGQRALASVIIRMTLAELFVKNYAFIALDEPTSNLDRANVLSLAKVIGQYVQRRQDHGSNIQWIIITHDEEFARALSNETWSNFFRVCKNSSGLSVIEQIDGCDNEHYCNEKK